MKPAAGRPSEPTTEASENKMDCPTGRRPKRLYLPALSRRPLEVQPRVSPEEAMMHRSCRSGSLVSSSLVGCKFILLAATLPKRRARFGIPLANLGAGGGTFSHFIGSESALELAPLCEPPGSDPKIDSLSGSSIFDAHTIGLAGIIFSL